jgi:hypothetical protein
MKPLVRVLVALALASAIRVTTVSAQNQLITVDETGKGNWNGIPLPASLQLEPMSGMTTLTYLLPFPGVPGDVQLIEVNRPQPNISDVIRFDGNSHLFFFSDQDGPPVDPADVGLPPPLAGWLTVSVPEIGPEGNNGAFYSPTGGPGDNTAGASYHFISDAVPEPASLLLLALGGLAVIRRRTAVV